MTNYTRQVSSCCKTCLLIFLSCFSPLGFCWQLFACVEGSVFINVGVFNVAVLGDTRKLFSPCTESTSNMGRSSVTFCENSKLPCNTKFAFEMHHTNIERPATAVDLTSWTEPHPSIPKRESNCSANIFTKKVPHQQNSRNSMLAPDILQHRRVKSSFQISLDWKRQNIVRVHTNSKTMEINTLYQRMIDMACGSPSVPKCLLLWNNAEAKIFLFSLSYALKVLISSLYSGTVRSMWSWIEAISTACSVFVLCTQLLSGNFRNPVSNFVVFFYFILFFFVAESRTARRLDSDWIEPREWRRFHATMLTVTPASTSTYIRARRWLHCRWEPSPFQITAQEMNFPLIWFINRNPSRRTLFHQCQILKTSENTWKSPQDNLCGAEIHGSVVRSTDSVTRLNQKRARARAQVFWC